MFRYFVSLGQLNLLGAQMITIKWTIKCWWSHKFKICFHHFRYMISAVNLSLAGAVTFRKAQAIVIATDAKMARVTQLAALNLVSV